MGKIKREKQQIRKLIDYVDQGRKCGNCCHYEPSVYGQPAFGELPPMPHKPEECGLHFIRVNKQAICKDWKSK